MLTVLRRVIAVLILTAYASAVLVQHPSHTPWPAT